MKTKQVVQELLRRVVSWKARQHMALVGAWSEDGVLRGLFPLSFVPDMAPSNSHGMNEPCEFSADLPLPAELAAH